MKPKRTNHTQGLFFESRLSQILNPQHELFRLSEQIDWKSIEQQVDVCFQDQGRPAKPVRLIVGIFMLQQISGLSDEMAVYRWVENPYWQFFCGYDFLQWSFPIDPTTLVRWRRRLKKRGLEKILSETVNTAKRTGTIQTRSLEQVIVDTTVMEKNITYPTDSKLYHKARENLVRLAKRHGIALRQAYTRNSKKALFQACRYIHARQMRRAKRQIKKLKTYLGRTVRDIKRKIDGRKELELYFQSHLEIAEKILTQEKKSPNKVYSIHAPEVECIAKGKLHKKYEFGCKVSLVTTHKEGLVLSSQALHGNPYDGHTLEDALKSAEEVSSKEIKRAFVDKGYKGHKLDGKEVFISGQKRGMTNYFKKLLKRRQSIEPHIGHMKSEGKLDRNYLKGSLGDQMSSILVGIGHNLRLVLAKLRKGFVDPCSSPG
uniref:Transposase, IS5 family n=1 Tax=Candidatus Kentrum sp. LPFa TaxID=2126335 RepID=A0A450X5X5_9GAMM|nr:MAG: transposase, IS5 family [Candidatus Kentron sp. LPFa]